jgi:tryptophan synthase alpha chain
MNRIDACFERQKPGEKIMSLFITAGYPRPEDTVELVLRLEKAGADMI